MGGGGRWGSHVCVGVSARRARVCTCACALVEAHPPRKAGQRPAHARAPQGAPTCSLLDLLEGLREEPHPLVTHGLSQDLRASRGLIKLRGDPSANTPWAWPCARRRGRPHQKRQRHTSTTCPVNKQTLLNPMFHAPRAAFLRATVLACASIKGRRWFESVLLRRRQAARQVPAAQRPSSDAPLSAAPRCCVAAPACASRARPSPRRARCRAAC